MCDSKTLNHHVTHNLAEIDRIPSYSVSAIYTLLRFLCLLHVCRFKDAVIMNSCCTERPANSQEFMNETPGGGLEASCTTRKLGF